VGKIFVTGMGCETDWLEKSVNVKYCTDDQYCCHEDDQYYCCSSAEFISIRQVHGLHIQSFHLNL
jgi:hypothetical protein